MEFTIGTLVLVSFVVSLVALVVLIWTISRSEMRFTQANAHTISEAEARGEGLDDPGTRPEQTGSPQGRDGDSLVPESSRRIILFVFATATLWLLLGSSFGLIASLKLHLPDWLNSVAPLTFGRMRTMHLNLVIYGWLSLGLMGLALWLIPTIFATRLRLPSVAMAGAVLMNLSVGAGVWAIGSGWTDGLEWIEIPWQIDIFIAISVFLFVVPLLVTARHRNVRHIYVTGWYYLGAMVWFPVLFIVANIPGLHSGVQQATVNWWFAHNVLGLWLTPLGVGAAYYLLPRIIGKPIYSYSLSLVGFWALALFYSQVGMHHLIGGPVPTWVVTLSVVQSIMMFVPVIAVAVNQHPLWLGNLGAFRASIPLRFVAIGALMYTAASMQGSIEALRSVSSVTHFTHYTVGHAHLGAYAFVTFVLFDALYYVIPRLVGRVWPFPSFIVAHWWLVVVGFAIYFASLTFGGWLQGKARQGKAMLDPTRDWIESMELTVPYLTGRSVGGPLMVLGHFAFAFNLIGILVGRGAERKAGAGLALCQAGGKGLVATESERFDDGVRATVDDTEVLVGSRGFLSCNGVTPPEEGQHEAGLTAVHMATDGAWVATFLLGDALRPDAAATIAQLRASGLMLGMASGDAPTPCAHVGAAAGLTPSEIHAACTPEVKAELVGAGPGPTAFVGDGVNDMLAIVRADVGVAATDASPATIALADVVIARGGMKAVGEAITISRQARRVLRQNLVFSVAYNVLALGLAVGGTVPPLAAAGAMAASSLMVIANAGRLRVPLQR